jgi:hypothetical protein
MLHSSLSAIEEHQKQERIQGALTYENLPKQGGVSFVISIPIESMPR